MTPPPGVDRWSWPGHRGGDRGGLWLRCVAGWCVVTPHVVMQVSCFCLLCVRVCGCVLLLVLVRVLCGGVGVGGRVWAMPLSLAACCLLT